MSDELIEELERTSSLLDELSSLLDTIALLPEEINSEPIVLDDSSLEALEIILLGSSLDASDELNEIILLKSSLDSKDPSEERLEAELWIASELELLDEATISSDLEDELLSTSADVYSADTHRTARFFFVILFTGNEQGE